MAITDIDILNAGVSPLIAAYCREIRLAEITNEMLTWDEKQWNVSPGDLLVAMVINLLVDRAPMYRIREFYRNRDLDLLFGNGKVSLESLNDRHFGALLDRMGEAGAQSLYHSITASAITTHNVDLSQLHADTTSKSVHGAYDKDDESLNITYGHSKDSRPDLKQFLYGLIVADGVPVSGKIMDGNTSDKTWNKDIMKELATVFTPQIAKNTLYIADSAFVSKGALTNAHQQKIKFITRLPNNYKIAKALKEKALVAEQWEEVGSFSNDKKAAKYRLCESQAMLYDQPYRFIVVHSSALDKRKQKKINNHIEKQEKELKKQCKNLSKRTFACQADALAEFEKFQKDHRQAYYALEGNTYSQVQVKKRQGRGRPPADYKPEYETVWYIKCTIGALKSEQVQADLDMEAMFIIMSNQLDNEILPAADLLKRYKEQNNVEMRFRWLKDPTVVKQIWLDTPRRVMALGYVFLIGLLIYCLLERRIRSNLARQTKPIRLHGNRLTKKPTAVAYFQLFTDIVTLRTRDSDGNTIRGVPPRYETEELKRALNLAGFSLDLYSELPN